MICNLHLKSNKGIILWTTKSVGALIAPIIYPLSKYFNSAYEKSNERRNE